MLSKHNTIMYTVESRKKRTWLKVSVLHPKVGVACHGVKL